MSKERAHQCGIVADFGKLRGHARCQALALLQWPARMACTVGVAPHQFVRIQLGRIARQPVQGQPALGEAT